MPTNREIADQLREIYELMQLAGENRFRAIAFERAARTIGELDEPVSEYVKSEKLTELKGIGSSIADDIEAFLRTGSIPVLEDLRKRVPEGLIGWRHISGLGPKKIAMIHKELGITEIEKLRRACEDGRVAALSGLGEKSAQKIARSIDWLERFGRRSLLSEALEVAEPILSSLKEQPGVERIETAGSLRRNRETIGDIDILISAKEEDASLIFDAFVADDQVVEVLGRGETKSSVRTVTGRQVDLRIVTPAHFPAALLYFTGSKEHNVELRQRARERGLSLNEYGLFPLTDDGEADMSRPLEAGSEKQIYRRLGLHFVPPELREGRGEVGEFEQTEQLLLVEESNIRGVIHAHSNWSDGKYSIEEMARASLDRGYDYLGISDHSVSAAYAGGLSPEEVKRQWEEIDRLNEQLAGEGYTFTIFKGIESDILPDGSLDYPEEILQGFDFVIASVHSGLGMPRKKMMERFRRAIEHPATRIIGHPTGRLLLRREESELDMDQLISLAAGNRTAIEINSNPWRLDLDWRHGRRARDAGLFTSINPDAHTVDGIDDIRYGVKIARKARFEKERVINTFSIPEFSRWISEAGG